MFQAQSDDEAVKLALAVREAVKEFQALDTSSLEKFINRDWLFFTRMFYSPVKVLFHFKVDEGVAETDRRGIFVL